jgi:hypothetical protein
MQQAEIGRISFSASLCKKQDPLFKTTKVKRAEGITQVVEHLPANSKFKVQIPLMPREDSKEHYVK